MRQVSSVKLLTDVTATGPGAAHLMWGAYHTFQATGTTSAGAGAATVVVQVSDVTSPGTGDTSGDWITLGTITLTLSTTSSSDGLASTAAWRWVRGRVTAISGTDGTVQLFMGA